LSSYIRTALTDQSFLLRFGTSQVPTDSRQPSKHLPIKDDALTHSGFDIASAFGLFVVMKPVVAPRSIFLDSKLRKDFGGGRFAPLTDATLYGEDLGQAKVSETVAGTIAQIRFGRKE